jgi:hypothetical protein
MVGPRDIFAQAFTTRQDLSVTKLTRWERSLLDAGIQDADAMVVFRPGSERGVLLTKGEFLDQGLSLDRKGLTYSVAGQPVSDFSRWLLGARGEFSAITLRTNGRQYALTPSYSLMNISPNMSMSLSSNVGNLMSLTEGMTPQYNHMFSGDLRDSGAGVEVARGRLVMNSYRFDAAPYTTMTRFDFEADRLNGSLLVGTGLQGYNFVGFRGFWHVYNSDVQTDALYAQRFGGGAGVAGSLQVEGSFTNNRVTYRLGLEGYHLFGGAIGGGIDPVLAPVLGQPLGGPESGIQLQLELSR